MNERDMIRNHQHHAYRIGRRLLAVVAVVLLAASGCSTGPGTKDDKDASKLAQGGSTNVDAKKEFEEAVAVYEKQGDKGIDDAISALEDAVDEDPGFGKAWFNLGLLYEKNGEKEDAREAYKQAIKTAPKLGAPHVNLGMMALDEGKMDQAREHFRSALEAENYNPAAHNNISVFFRQDGDYGKAVRHARLSLAGDASNVKAYANLARIYYARGNHDVAKLVILNALKMEQGLKEPDLRNILGLVELARKDVTEAIRQFQKAIELKPDHVSARMNLGAVILNVRDYERALGHFQKVLEEDPDNTEAKISIAVAKRGMGDLKAAEKIYKEILEKEPKNAIVQYNLGVLEHEHKAQDATAGVGREPPAQPKGDGAAAQLEASAANTQWNVENLENAIEHYNQAIEHYRNFLAYDQSGNEEHRKEANERIAQVTKIIEATNEQLPQLRSTVKDLRQQAEMMKEQEAKAAAEAEKKKQEQNKPQDESGSGGDEPAGDGTAKEQPNAGSQEAASAEGGS